MRKKTQTIYSSEHWGRETSGWALAGMHLQEAGGPWWAPREKAGRKGRGQILAGSVLRVDAQMRTATHTPVWGIGAMSSCTGEHEEELIL